MRLKGGIEVTTQGYPLTDGQRWLLDRQAKRSGADVEAFLRLHEDRNAALIADWASTAPGADAALLEVTLRASGRPRRRLLDRLPYGCRKGETGWVRYRHATTFEFLNFHTIEAAIFAFASDAELVDWKFVSDAKVWAGPPSLTQPPS